MDDVWIEVTEIPPNFDGRFFRQWAEQMPQHGSSISRMKILLNLTAYVKHVIEQSKSGE